ncbi:MAG TPA: hypothetical protein PK514_14635 [Spirochaetota bacterium]|nr:hypothetical protein [Spirochaetota bacterium]
MSLSQRRGGAKVKKIMKIKVDEKAEGVIVDFYDAARNINWSRIFV